MNKTTTTPDTTTAQQTARFTWRDLVDLNSTLRGLCRLYDADRGHLMDELAELNEETAADESIGGFLLWNSTRDEEGGHLIMLTGQTPDQERAVIANAAWMASGGAVYAASRVGATGWKAAEHCRAQIGGDEHLVWVISNHERWGS